MSKNNYIHRNLAQELKRVQEFYSVLVLTGPRQSGKTTLCKNVFSDFQYFNLEDINLWEQIMLSPPEKK